MLRGLSGHPTLLVVALVVLLLSLVATTVATVVTMGALRSVAEGATAATRARLRERIDGLAGRAASLVVIVAMLGFAPSRLWPAAFLAGATVSAAARMLAVVVRAGGRRAPAPVPGRGPRAGAFVAAAVVVLGITVAACARVSPAVAAAVAPLAVALVLAVVTTEAATRTVLARAPLPDLTRADDVRVRATVTRRMARTEALAILLAALTVLTLTGGPVATAAGILLGLSLPVWLSIPLGRPRE